MPITAVTIENFKGIREPVRVDLKPITLLFGPNSAGKSSVVHALHYAREVFERGNLNPDQTIVGGKAVDLGGFKTLVYNNDINFPVRFRFDLDLSEIDLSDYLLPRREMREVESPSDWENSLNECLSEVESAWVEYAVVWDGEKEEPVVDVYQIGINGRLLGEIKRLRTSPSPTMLELNPHPILEERIDTYDYLIKEEEDAWGAYETAGALPPEEESWKIQRHENELSDRLEQKLAEVEKQWNDLEGAPRLMHPISLDLRQYSVLPRWEQCIEFENTIWDSESKSEDLFHTSLLSTLIVSPGNIVRSELTRFRYLGPLREVPQRNYVPLLSPDESQWANGIAAWNVLYEADTDFLEELNSWLTEEQRLNSGYEIRRKIFKELDVNSSTWVALMRDVVLDEDQDIRESLISLPEKVRLYLREWKTGIEVMPQDIGVGISQVLPVVVLTLYSKTGIVAIEQPELHIHPAFQVALGDLFISQINEKDVTFLLETHSEHLMLRLLRRIRETNENALPPGKDPLAPNDLAVYYVEQSEGGITTTPIRINEEGDFIDRWPKGFFSERMEELF